jgi:cell division protein FtsI (penicillin-binding protein 3)
MTAWSFPWNKNNEDDFKEKRVLSESEAQTLRLLLAGVMAPSGTGRSAVVPGYPVAGKTGTAQKVNPHGRGYLSGAYISSFVGMIPANQPRFVIYVAVDSPRKQYYGSQVAGPLFSRIATFAVRHEGLAPRWLDEQQAQGLLPAINVGQIKEPLKESRNKKTAATQADLASSIVDKHLVTEASEASAVEGTYQPLMPNLETLTLREVQGQLQKLELKVNIHGSGRVSRFEPEAGTPLKENAEVDVWLAQ